jgi:hypothetical protein
MSISERMQKAALLLKPGQMVTVFLPSIPRCLPTACSRVHIVWRPSCTDGICHLIIPNCLS